MVLCYTVSEGDKLRVTLREDTWSLLGTTVTGDVFWVEIVDCLSIRANWMNVLVVGLPKVSDGILFEDLSYETKRHAVLCHLTWMTKVFLLQSGGNGITICHCHWRSRIYLHIGANLFCTNL